MAFITAQEPAVAYRQIRQAMAEVKAMAQQAHANSVAGTVTSYQVNALLETLRARRAKAEGLRVVPGLVAYAQSAYPDSPGYNPTAEYLATRAAIDSLITWLVTNYPNGSGRVETHTLLSDGTAVPITHAADDPGMAAFRTQVQALIDTIS